MPRTGRGNPTRYGMGFVIWDFRILRFSKIFRFCHSGPQNQWFFKMYQWNENFQIISIATDTASWEIHIQSLPNAISIQNKALWKSMIFQNFEIVWLQIRGPSWTTKKLSKYCGLTNVSRPEVVKASRAAHNDRQTLSIYPGNVPKHDFYDPSRLAPHKREHWKY